MFLTIFTPAYNRAYIIKRLYDSLLEQTCPCFEWIIIDDGSTDETETLISSFLREGKIDIHYLKRSNGGKHRAINQGVKKARGELFFIVDSDDLLPSDAVEILYHYYEKVRMDNTFAGISGIRVNMANERIGGELNIDCIQATSLDIRMKYGIQGDLAEAYKTSVLKEFPFPEYEDEKFCPEALIWNRIAQKYKLLLFNKPVYICEYLDDGLTAKIVKVRMQSPLASMDTYAELSSYNIPKIQKMKASVNFWRFSFHSDMRLKDKIKRIGYVKSYVSIPIAFLMYLYDKKNI